MDEEYKDRIVELKSKGPATPSEQHEARIEELKVASTTITLCLEDAQKLLNDATSTWSTIEEILDLMTLCEEVQKTQQELQVVTTAMKDFPTLQQMIKMGENKKLQGD